MYHRATQLRYLKKKKSDAKYIERRKIIDLKSYHKRKDNPILKERRKKYANKYRPSHKRNMKEYHLVKNYGITLSQFEQMLISQDNRCAICKKLFADGINTRPSVDHNHQTGQVRALLCNKCNITISSESIVILESAIQYLIKWNKNPIESDVSDSVNPEKALDS